ncbi:GTPase ObgE [Ruminococcaceae bacterium OttesenSCG-928-L11]|nr:GTPase ObgE [Ruminococcaceae bacterium OttesenSCG-928-L11]
MFVDVAKIKLKAGDGGAGAVAFHREKYVASGGPDGGDGGKGGDIIFIADKNLSTLADFRYKRKYVAANGEPGRGANCSGKGGANLVIKVPEGTLIKEQSTGRILADVSGPDPFVIAKGGRGGWGNQHFATPTRQIPRFAKPGLPGEEYEVTLELKLLADVGLVGFPNVGKSTLINFVSEAKSRIANYHFTTLSPVLGVVRVEEDKSFVMADIPGLIEGASEGVGLGHEFLRHVDRCRLLVHIVDVSGIEGRDPQEDFEKINRELALFNEELASRPQIVAANKCDMAAEEQIEAFRAYIEEQGYEYFPISAATGQGSQPLIYAVSRMLDTLPPIKSYEREELTPEQMVERQSRQEFTVTIDDGVYVVEADWLGQILGSVNMDDYESLQYFQRVLRSSGIIDKLDEMGVREGDTVSILGFEFDYVI